MIALTCQDAMAAYLLDHDVRSTTEAYYQRAVSVYRQWLASQVEPLRFDSKTVSMFLRDKQAEGKSSYYRRSLRSALVALLRHIGDEGRVRPVRLEPLEVTSWTPSEVSRLVGASRQYRHPRDSSYWPTIIQAAYYSGFSQGDLWLLEKTDISPLGIAVIHRSRTSRREVGWIPLEILELRPREGKLWKRPYSAEMFRRHFARIVNAAGLTGTFKRLRKSSGTGVEELHPGKGHEHLGNTRVIFERHYWSRKQLPEPFRPPPLPE